MKLKLSDALNLAGSINELIAARTPKPTAFAFKIALNAKMLDPVLKSYDEQRQALLMQYAVKGDDGKPALINDGTAYDLGSNAKAFNDAMIEAQAIEISIKLQTITIDKFPAEIDPIIMMGLMPIIEAEIDNVVPMKKDEAA